MASSLMYKELVAEPAAVLDGISDLKRRSHILSSLVHLEAEPKTEIVEGATWRETRKVLNATFTCDVVVSKVTPGVGFTLETALEGETIDFIYRVKPSAMGVRLEIEIVEAEAVGLNKRLRGLISGGAMRMAKDIVERDIDDLRAALRT